MIMYPFFLLGWVLVFIILIKRRVTLDRLRFEVCSLHITTLSLVWFSLLVIMGLSAYLIAVTPEGMYPFPFVETNDGFHYPSDNWFAWVIGSELVLALKLIVVVVVVFLDF